MKYVTSGLSSIEKVRQLISLPVLLCLIMITSQEMVVVNPISLLLGHLNEDR